MIYINMIEDIVFENGTSLKILFNSYIFLECLCFHVLGLRLANKTLSLPINLPFEHTYNC